MFNQQEETVAKKTNAQKEQEKQMKELQDQLQQMQETNPIGFALHVILQTYERGASLIIEGQKYQTEAFTRLTHLLANQLEKTAIEEENNG